LVRENIDAILKLVPPQKLVMGIANYAYDWPEKSGKKPANKRASKASGSPRYLLGIGSANPVRCGLAQSYYSYSDDHDHIHRVWLLDGVTAYNELRAAERVGVQGTALWRLARRTPPSGRSGYQAPDDTTRAKLEEMPLGTTDP